MPATGMAFDDLELIYAQLAEAIDAAGPQREGLFLAKAVLALAHALGDRAQVATILKASLEDLPPIEDAPPRGA